MDSNEQNINIQKKPKRNYDKNLLDESIKKDCAILIGQYDKLDKNIIISFICHCGCDDNNTKTFKNIVDNGGAYCKKCTQINNVKKGNKTKEDKLSSEEKEEKIKQLEIKNKEDSEEKIKREERDEIISKIDHISIKNDEWFVHPELSNYESNRNCIIRNKLTNKIVNGSKIKSGRETITINEKKHQKHRFMMECIYNIVLSRDYDIDHIDSDPSNNKLENLQILTRKEHTLKTKKCQKKDDTYINKLSKPLKYVKDDKEYFFKSINDASRILGTDRKTIKNSLKLKKPDYNNRLWIQIIDTNEIKDEVWKTLENFDGLLISNKGRVQNKNVANQQITRGTKEGDYYIIGYKNKTYKVHQLVCMAFNGLPSDKTMTVDHIDKNSLNNCSENLRWATKQEQALNRETVKPVELYDLNTFKIIKKYNSQSEIVNEYNINQSIVNTCLLLSRNNNNNIKYRIGSKDLSVRYSNMSLDEKKEREKVILNYDIEILNRDKNKRKSNIENLPLHITKSGLKYYLKIKFRTISCEESSTDLNELIEIKNNWLTNEINKYMDKINNMIEDYSESNLNIIQN
jgi:hypothetical protein